VLTLGKVAATLHGGARHDLARPLDLLDADFGTLLPESEDRGWRGHERQVGPTLRLRPELAMG
jgi:hypothetical protein